MQSRRRRARQEDSNVWIAYTDLLTALLTFFVILAFVGMYRLQAKGGSGMHAELFGQVIDEKSREMVAGCSVKLGEQKTKTDAEGKFSFKNIDVSTGDHVRLVFTAAGSEPEPQTFQLKPGVNTHTFFLVKAHEGNTGDVKVLVLEGDAYFDSGRADIKPDSLKKLIDKGREYSKGLQKDEILVIQGYTDDVSYKDKSKSNWELSGERAAALCRVFEEQLNIPGKQLAIMGYGQFRELAHVNDESDLDKETKRKKNRRITIVKLKGTSEIFAAADKSDK